MFSLRATRPAGVLSTHCRGYAFSRHGHRPTGAGRRYTRPDVRERDRNVNDAEDTSSSFDPNYTRTDSPNYSKFDESNLWEAAQRPPASDPKESLKILLTPRNDALVIERQIEMMNIFLGFEQTNKYSISDDSGRTLGYVLEEPRGLRAMLSRQAFATHRPFKALIMDTAGTPLLWLRRPFSWINSRMYVQRLDQYNHYSPGGEPILDTFGEVQQVWHPWRRKYDLFISEGNTRRTLSLASEPQPEPEPTGVTFHQFAQVDSGFLAWRFGALNAHGKEMATIDRAFRGIGRELFTDTGRYIVSFRPLPTELSDGAELLPTGGSSSLTLDQRALLLGLAVNIDFDYFSRHSRAGGGGGIFHFGSMN